MLSQMSIKPIIIYSCTGGKCHHILYRQSGHTIPRRLYYRYQYILVHTQRFLNNWSYFGFSPTYVNTHRQLFRWSVDCHCVSDHIITWLFLNSWTQPIGRIMASHGSLDVAFLDSIRSNDNINYQVIITGPNWVIGGRFIYY